MNDVSIDMQLRRSTWTEAAATATKLNNITVNKEGEKTAHKNSTRQCPSTQVYLEICRDWKLENRATVCVLLGYA